MNEPEILQTTQTEPAPIAAASVFTEPALSPALARAVALMGFTEPTPVQAQAIPLIRAGHDLVARSQTGTGKTVAFGLPAIQMVEEAEDKKSIRAIILCPTRELAMQAAEEIRKLARFLPDIYPVEVYGGAPMDKQCIRLRRANIVVGTPGRILDHIRRKSIKLGKVSMVVLDEADEMLNMGFKEDIETILGEMPEERQTVLFSATMPDAIMALTRQYQKDPRLVEIDKARVTLDNITQTYINVPHSAKINAVDLLLQFYHPACAMVFCNTKTMVDELSAHLAETGILAEGLHGDMKQAQRTTVMQAFKSGRTHVLVATDVAARGIDVNDVEYVINFDVPQNTEYYIHRIGRTGRAGKSGMSITVCGTRRDVIVMQSMARAVKSEITELVLPSVGDVHRRAGEDLMGKLEKVLQDGVGENAEALVQQLLDKGYRANQIAAAAVRLLGADHADQTAHLQDMPAMPGHFKRGTGKPRATGEKYAEGRADGSRAPRAGARPFGGPARPGKGGKPFAHKKKAAAPGGKLPRRKASQG